MIIGLYFYITENHHINLNSQHIHKTLYISREFDQNEVMYITKAAYEWSEATHHIVDFDIIVLPNNNINITNDDVLFLKVSPDFPDIIQVDQLNNDTTLGLYDESQSIAVIEVVYTRINENNYSPADYKGLFLHELGHSLGLKHSAEIDGLGTVMYPILDYGSNYITKTDLKQFCEIYDCSGQLLF